MGTRDRKLIRQQEGMSEGQGGESLTSKLIPFLGFVDPGVHKKDQGLGSSGLMKCWGGEYLRRKCWGLEFLTKGIWRNITQGKNDMREPGKGALQIYLLLKDTSRSNWGGMRWDVLSTKSFMGTFMGRQSPICICSFLLWSLCKCLSLAV